MKKGFTCLALTALFSGFIGSANANANANAIFPLSQIIKSYAQESKIVKKATSDKYTNFSGTWHGSCVDSMDSNDTIETTVVIENDKENFTIDGMPFSIANVKTLSEMGKNETTVAHFKLAWTEKGSLIMRVVGFYNSFSSQDSLPFPLNYLAFSSKLSFALENNKLVINQTSTGFSDTIPNEGEPNTMICTLERVK